jgi:predicted nucleic acid-binding protein
VRPLIFNSTPLIYIPNVGLSKIFEDLKEEKLTSLGVKREVVDEGRRKGVADAIILDKLFVNNVFRVVEPKDKEFLSWLLETTGLHVTDAEVLSLARERRGLAVIDDEVARKTAKVYAVSYVGTPYILVRAIFEGFLTKEKARQAVNNVVSAGWRCSVESYALIMKALERVQC